MIHFWTLSTYPALHPTPKHLIKLKVVNALLTEFYDKGNITNTDALLSYMLKLAAKHRF